MRKIITTLLLFFLVIFSTVAQNVIKGVVVDSEENNQLKGVAINVKESTVSTLTNENGVFILQNLSNGSYVLEISYKGYETQNFPVELTGNTIDLGTILLYEDLTEEEKGPNISPEMSYEEDDDIEGRSGGGTFSGGTRGKTENSKSKTP